MPKIQNTDLTTYFEIVGDGPPILFISGLSLDHVIWKVFQVPPLVAAGYKCIVFDNRDVGQTGDGALVSYGISQLAEDTAGLIRQLGLSSLHVVGYSMGGMAAQELAINHPELVRTLTLLSTAPKADAYAVTLLETLEAAKRKMTPTEFFQTAGLRVFTYRFYENPQAVQMFIDRVLANPYPQSVEGYARQCNAIKSHDAINRLHKITVPTHVIYGKEDILTPPRHSITLAAKIPGAKVTVIEEGGHALYAENTASLNQAILEFIGNR